MNGSWGGPGHMRVHVTHVARITFARVSSPPFPSLSLSLPIGHVREGRHSQRHESPVQGRGGVAGEYQVRGGGSHGDVRGSRLVPGQRGREGRVGWLRGRLLRGRVGAAAQTAEGGRAGSAGCGGAIGCGWCVRGGGGAGPAARYLCHDPRDEVLVGLELLAELPLLGQVHRQALLKVLGGKGRG